MKQLDPKYKKKLFLISFISFWFSILIVAVPALIAWSFSTEKIIPSLLQTGIALGLVVLISVLLWLWALGTHHFFRYELRNEGLRKESGIIWKTYSTIPYSRIQNIDIKRGLFDRIFGLSRLLVQTAGSGNPHYGYAEGIFPGLTAETAEKLRDDIIKRVNTSKTSQGL